MLTNESSSTSLEQYLVSRNISPETSIFFDIETTGFKPEYSHLYLIGTAFCRPGAPSCPSGKRDWTILQWLCEKPQDEPQLLRTFAGFLQSYDTIIHFNGDRFDLPYLENKYEQYGIPSPFRKMKSIDLYQDFRPLRSFLRLEHMNQKSLELFLGLEREDQYDGGKLIPVYRNFCKTGSPEKAELLLLHNREDVSGMLTLTRLYSYLNFLEPETAENVLSGDSFPPAKQFTKISSEVLENRDGTKKLLFTFPLKTQVPVPVSRSYDFGYLTLNKSTGKLLLPMLKDTLYYYFADYKNYYYLPREDQAIHKSVAAYVDKEYRQPATKTNCYTKQTGLFLPQPEELFTPAFRRSCDDTLSWFLWKEEEWEDPSRKARYLDSLTRAICRQK